ncbi:hypothetical protein CRG98_049331, partial [Punica granatum]
REGRHGVVEPDPVRDDRSGRRGVGLIHCRESAEELGIRTGEGFWPGRDVIWLATLVDFWKGDLRISIPPMFHHWPPAGQHLNRLK